MSSQLPYTAPSTSICTSIERFRHRYYTAAVRVVMSSCQAQYCPWWSNDDATNMYIYIPADTEDARDIDQKQGFLPSTLLFHVLLLCRSKRESLTIYSSGMCGEDHVAPLPHEYIPVLPCLVTRTLISRYCC